MEKCVMKYEDAMQNIKDEEVPRLGKDGFPNDNLIESHIVAIQALETMEEMEKRGITQDIILEYAKFEDECVKKGFSFQSLLEAREKQIPRKLCKNILDDGSMTCICGSDIDVIDRFMYCPYCGQKLDWNEES